MMRYFYYLIWLIIIILGVTFASLNAAHVTLHYYIGKVQISLSLLLLITLLIGFLLGLLVSFPKVWYAKRKTRKAHAQIKKHEQEIKSLRVNSIRDEH